MRRFAEVIRGIMRILIGMLLVVLLLPLILLGLIVCFAWGIILRIWFWMAHVRHGRFVLFVYSESPKWQEYIESNILPRVREHAVVLNWSERRLWSKTVPWEARFHRYFGGSRDFNPIAIAWVNFFRIKRVRFHQAFRDFKHGNETALREAEMVLFRLVPDRGPSNQPDGEKNG